MIFLISLICLVQHFLTRTDFYLIQEKADQAYGFPPGVSEQIVRNVIIKSDNLENAKIILSRVYIYFLSRHFENMTISLKQNSGKNLELVKKIKFR